MNRHRFHLGELVWYVKATNIPSIAFAKIEEVHYNATKTYYTMSDMVKVDDEFVFKFKNRKKAFDTYHKLLKEDKT